MRRPIHAAILSLPALLALLLSGCEQRGIADSGDFAPGAFPPIISDMDYHRNAWTRSDCLTCHETGLQNAPLMKHTSVPPLAKDSKCRTCHVFVAGSPPKPLSP